MTTLAPESFDDETETHHLTSGSTMKRASFTDSDKADENLLKAVMGMRQELKQVKDETRENKKGLVSSILMGAMLIALSIGLTLAVVQHGQAAVPSVGERLLSVGADKRGRLVDRSSGAAIVATPEASFIKLEPEEDMIRRKLTQKMRNLVGYERSLEDEYLGTAPASDVGYAYKKATQNSEGVQVEVVVNGVTYTRAIKTDAMSAETGSRRRRGRRLEVTGADEEVTIYKGISLTDDPTQLFELECPVSGEACEVFSNGEFIPTRRLDACFSPESTVFTEQRSKIRMKELNIGDKVLTSSGTYQKVYAFLHRVPEVWWAAMTPYLQIVTENDFTDPLEISTKHMVYVNNQKHPIEAGHVQVGDDLRMLEPGSDKAQAAKVVSIQKVYRQGLFSPATEDGTIVVGGIVASIYSNPGLEATENVEFGNGKIIMHRAEFSHMLASPMRFACLYLNSNICAIDMEEESYMPGMLMIESIYKFMKSSGLDGIQNTVWVVVAIVLHILELAVIYLCIPGALSGLVYLAVSRWVVVRSMHSSKKID